MHNWNNLNLFLTLDEQFQDKKKQLALLLIDACTKNDKNLVVQAMKAGAYINSSADYQTPLMACVEANAMELARYLIKVGASASMMVQEKDAVWMSLYDRKHDFLAMFFEGKFKQNTLKEKGTTLLMYATQTSDLEAVETIAYKTNVNQRDVLGNTALHYNFAIKEPTADDVAIGKILLACGSDTNSQNLEGLSPKDMALSESANVLVERNELEDGLDEIAPDIKPPAPGASKKFKI